jgi:hypothetical protein
VIHLNGEREVIDEGWMIGWFANAESIVDRLGSDTDKENTL